MTVNFQPASAWTDTFLEPMRQIGDPPADSAVETMFATGDVDAINALMRNLVANDGMLPDALPEAVKAFLQTTEDLPPFADPAKIALAESVFFEWGPQIILVLHCYSLPFCYADRKGVQVLALTGRLSGNAARRIIEVAQMMVDVLQPAGLTSSDGRGRRTLQKVRLMHAAVRHLALQSPLWKSEWDVPINQEDLAGTLMSFSWVILDGLRKLGIVLKPEEQDAWLHFWQIVGEQLGLRQDMVPLDMESSTALARTFQRRLYAACPEGQLMTAALIQAMQYELPGNLLDGLPSRFLTFFMGAESAQLLGVHVALDEALFAPLAAAGILLTGIHQDEAIRKAAEIMGRFLVNAAVLVARGGNRPSFAIPDQLKQQWGVNWLG